MSNRRPIKPVRVDTSCCAGYKEFTFYGITFPEQTVPLNITTSNFIPAVTEAISSQAIRLTFPTLSAYILDETVVQILGTAANGTTITIGYNGNNTIDISWGNLGVLSGVFTVKIWVNNLQLYTEN